MDTNNSESGLTQNGSESKHVYTVLQSLPQYNQTTESGLFLHDDLVPSLPNTQIPLQMPQSSLEYNTNANSPTVSFFGDVRNLITQSGSYGVASSVSTGQNNGNFSLLEEKQNSKQLVTGPEQLASFSVTNFDKIDTCPNGGIQGSFHLSKNCSNNSTPVSNHIENTHIANILSIQGKSTSSVPHNAVNYFVRGSSDKLVIEKSTCEVGKNIVEAVCNNSKKSESFALNIDELDTAVVDVVEETIVTTPREHICVASEGSYLSSLSNYICGSCKTKYETICKLHDHFESKHSTGTYIYYQSTKMGFPRLENVCKFTQTDLDDLLEYEFKDDEVNDTDEYDIECGMNIFGENVKIDGTVSSDNNVEENMESVKTEEGKDKRKRKKAKHKRGKRETVTTAIPATDRTTRLKVNVTQAKDPKTSGNKSKKIERGNSELVNQSLETDEETDWDINLPIENAVIQSNHSEFPKAHNGKTAINSEDNSENMIGISKEFTSLKDSKNHNVIKQQKKVVPTQINLPESRITRIKISKERVQENINESSGSYSCGICSTKYISKAKLRYHMTKVHRKDNTDCQKQCRWCGLTFPGSNSYTAHTRQCEKNDNLLCLICNKKFNSRQEVANHLITHRNDSELKCRLCGRTFTCEVALQSHLRRHNLPKDLQCEQCGKSFYYHNLLKKHMLYCNREPDIVCPQCPLKFKTPDSLKHHMSVHSNERPFVCHICGYAAKKSMYLKRHLRSHTGERPYVCSECGMSFAAANGLNRHRKTHTNDKPCVCHFCGKSFTNNWNLKTHLRQHTGDTPYRCAQCGKAFKQNVLLKLHMKTHHPVETGLL